MQRPHFEKGITIDRGLSLLTFNSPQMRKYSLGYSTGYESRGLPDLERYVPHGRRFGVNFSAD